MSNEGPTPCLAAPQVLRGRGGGIRQFTRLAACAVALWLTPALASAQSLDWLTVDGDDCVTPSALEAELRRVMTRAPAVEGLEAEVRAEGRTARYVVRGAGEPAQRSLYDLPQACGARLEAVALSVALAVEHAVEEREREELPPEPEPAPEVPREPLERHVAIGLLAGANVGLLPRAAAEGRLSAFWQLGRVFALEWAASVTSPSRASLAEGELAAFALAGAMGACAGGRAGRARAHGCAWVSAGAVRGRGEGLSVTQTTWLPSGTAELGLAGAWPADARFALSYRLMGFVQWLRPRFQSLSADGSGPEDTRTLPGLGARLLLGASWSPR